MFSFKRESGVVVIEGHIAPAAGVMAGATVCAELTVVLILCGMAGITILWRSLIHAIHVTGTALNVCMFPRKRESGVIVIEGHVSPTAGVMAGTAVCAELTVVVVPVRVAGITIRGRTFIHSIHMTGTALNACVFSRKREGGVVVIEGHIVPAAGVVTGTAVRAELAVVLVLICMAGITIRRYTLIHAIDVTGITLNTCVFSRELETGLAVIETDIGPFGGLMT